MAKLTILHVKNAKPGVKLFKLSDGKGLQLWVFPDGAKRWRLAYRHAGKQKNLALGVYPTVSLAKAREAADKAREQVREGHDPSRLRALQKVSKGIAAANTFEAVAREWFERHMEVMSASHRVRTGRILEKDLYPQLVDRPISEIEPPELLGVLRQIEGRTVDIAHRAKQVASQVFRYAVATGRAQRDPTPDLKGALKVRRKEHYASITNPQELGILLRTIDHYPGMVVRAALLINALTFQRPGLVRAMEWEHVDLDAGMWSVPAEAMQKTHRAGVGHRAHTVPLSRQGIKVLRGIHALTGRGRYVFPSGRGASRCLSDNGMRTALRTMGYSNEQMTPHGWRATARTLLDEQLRIRVDIIEHQSARAVRDTTGRAYNRTTFLDDRIDMMQKWADYLWSLKAGED